MFHPVLQWKLGIRGAVAILAVVAIGCGRQSGPQRAPVAGTISIDGAPLKSGVIRFVPTGKTKGPAAVAIVEDGEFELNQIEGPVAGRHRIEIEATDFASFEIDDEQAYAEKAARGEQPIPANPIPATYNRQTTLVADISEEGDLELDFPLTTQRSQ